jgi:pimeloyl-ACP methyl ester carboxylesterase
MVNVRRYGRAPFSVAVIHGGPGAGGEMAPVAREIARERGTLEPIQTATSLPGQIEELRSVLEAFGDPPVTLIGFSWGAWLSLLVTVHHPALVRKLILVGSGPFEEANVAKLQQTRNDRLTPDERAEFDGILQALSDPETEDTSPLLARLGMLSSKTDAYDAVEAETMEGDWIPPQGEIFQGVWREAAAMRRSGRLLALAKDVRCPVLAIHGDYDPHPAEGVREPLTRVLDQFRFVLLDRCGHTPWTERHAWRQFYAVLQEELG